MPKFYWMKEREDKSMKITWIGTDDDVKGNIEFVTDKQLTVTPHSRRNQDFV